MFGLWKASCEDPQGCVSMGAKGGSEGDCVTGVGCGFMIPGVFWQVWRNECVVYVEKNVLLLGL